MASIALTMRSRSPRSAASCARAPSRRRERSASMRSRTARASLTMLRPSWRALSISASASAIDSWRRRAHLGVDLFALERGVALRLGPQLRGLGVDLVAQLLGVLLGLGPHLAGCLAGGGEDRGPPLRRARRRRWPRPARARLRDDSTPPARGGPPPRAPAPQPARPTAAAGRRAPRWDRTLAASS